MRAIFSSRRIGSSSQLTKSLKKPTFSSHPSQSRHFLSHLLPCGLSSSSSSLTRFVPSLLSRPEKIHGFFASTLRNTHLNLKSGNLLESRVGFFGSQLPSKGFEVEPWVFTGFQKRGWKSWVNGAHGVVFGLIIANAAVFTMWKVKDKRWMATNFVLSVYSFTTGRIHTLITSGFSHIVTSQIIFNMMMLCYFGTRIARTLGPLYLLKLYFAGALGSSVFFLSGHALMAILKSEGVVSKEPTRPNALAGADGAVFAITLLDILLYPKVTTYFALMFRVPALLGIVTLGHELLKVLEGKKKSITFGSIHTGGGAIVAAIAWRRIKKGRFYY
ncbi:rhomboid-like protein 17, chloroplastic [Eutrema salsugineum]|uniref:rhomboid-like protein 17, chloroplastic n=1 Tax=Eutrema salsugineum TaxID=72664 RepID=UPI000CECFF97|nr:rhomboid-like protein 17, chloroplastic [Eutrema salsugineum]